MGWAIKSWICSTATILKHKRHIISLIERIDLSSKTKVFWWKIALHSLLILVYIFWKIARNHLGRVKISLCVCLIYILNDKHTCSHSKGTICISNISGNIGSNFRTFSTKVLCFQLHYREIENCNNTGKSEQFQ